MGIWDQQKRTCVTVVQKMGKMVKDWCCYFDVILMRVSLILELGVS